MRRLGPRLLLALLPAVAACRAERTLLITSDPPGAVVRLNGEVIGKTPVRREFLYYGKRRVTVRREGYLTYAEVIELRGPWYARFPLDIVSEVLIPVGWKDRRHLHVELVRGEEVVATPELRSVLERAEILRRAGPEGPRELPPSRTRTLPPVPEDVPDPLHGDEGDEGDGGNGGDPPR